MRWLNLLWKFLKGKKTYIGGAVHIVAKGLDATGRPVAGQIAEAIATAIIGAGLIDLAKDKVAGAR